MGSQMQLNHTCAIQMGSQVHLTRGPGEAWGPTGNPKDSKQGSRRGPGEAWGPKGNPKDSKQRPCRGPGGGHMGGRGGKGVQ